MEFTEIQKDVDDWVGKHDPKYWPAFENLAHLMEEAGELSRNILDKYGQKKKRPEEPENNMGQEIVDIMFTLVCIANSHAIDLSKEWKDMFKNKLNGRDKDRFPKSIHNKRET